ncbi:putative iron-regulated membrane protein [Chitinophaga skermanii]|uniref:Putative iron-regulated membrane protein n=1 Tax=Chitinophaga skermanii TaxID=331697 RepID=A0A327Q7P4_9BACT|nr:PepSY-associated TM helix domain-containing protein [Chitinophaga skermanii]RAI99751.1 putative iron-regulated membrane protein [Chitinophaga skermanii]
MKKIFKIHSLAGIIAGALLLLLSLTGSLLVFSDEIDEAMHPMLFHVQPQGERKPLDSIYQAAAKSLEGNPIMNILRLPQEPNATCILRAEYGPERRIYVVVNPYTAEVIAQRSNTGYFSGWVMYLHFTLLSGFKGAWVILITGILFAISIITGIIIYRKSFAKVLTFKTKLEWRNKNRRWRNLHRIIGVWALIFNLIIVVTGIMMEIKVVNARKNGKVIQSTDLSAISFDALYTKAKEVFPDLRIMGIRTPKKQGDPVLFMGNTGGTKFFGEYNSSVALSATGEVKKLTNLNKATFGQKFQACIAPLHFGNFGGLFVKIIWCLLGLTPGILALSGSWILYKRTSKKKRK